MRKWLKVAAVTLVVAVVLVHALDVALPEHVELSCRLPNAWVALDALPEGEARAVDDEPRNAVSAPGMAKPFAGALDRSQLGRAREGPRRGEEAGHAKPLGGNLPDCQAR
jgi:hypothetical protein